MLTSTVSQIVEKKFLQLGCYRMARISLFLAFFTIASIYTNPLPSDDPNFEAIVRHCKRIVQKQCPYGTITRIEKLQNPTATQSAYQCFYTGLLGPYDESSFTTIVNATTPSSLPQC